MRGCVVYEYKSSMTLDMVEALTLTQNWLRSSLFMYATTNLQALVEKNEFMDSLVEGTNIYDYLVIYFQDFVIYSKSFLL